jgi:hypothetical protein
MRRYHRVRATTDVRRPFTITCGLVPGYGGKLPVPTADVRIAVRDWMTGRCERRRPYLTGVLTEGRVAYAWLEGDPTGPCSIAGTPVARHEPCLVFTGDVSVLYNPDLVDAEVTGLLDELADAMGRAARQTRVYVAYRDTTWVREAVGETSPRATAPTPGTE